MKQASTVFFILHRIGAQIEKTDIKELKSRKSPKVSLAATGGHQTLIKSLNARLLDLFEESISEEDNTRSTKFVAKEILKTPNRPLH